MRSNGTRTIWDFYFYKKKDRSDPKLPSIDIERDLWCWPFHFSWRQTWRSWSISLTCYFFGVGVSSGYIHLTKRCHFLRCYPRWSGLCIGVGGIELWLGFTYFLWLKHRLYCSLTNETRKLLRRTFHSGDNNDDK